MNRLIPSFEEVLRWFFSQRISAVDRFLEKFSFKLSDELNQLDDSPQIYRADFFDGKATKKSLRSKLDVIEYRESQAFIHYERLIDDY